MSFRSWAIRGLILSGVAGLAAFLWVANSWVSPERVRAQVIANLSQQLDDSVQIHLGSARMRILGGIAVSDLRLTRQTPAGEVVLLSVPSAVLYHDKEQLNRGQLVIKKIDLENPELYLERAPDGKWNLAGIVKNDVTVTADKPVPTFVIKDGTIHIRDRGAQPLPDITLTSVQLTLLNDPIPVLAIQARATSKKLGPIVARASKNRITGVIGFYVELAEFPLGEVVAGNVERFAPGLSQHLAGLTATAGITAHLTYTPTESGEGQWQHNIHLEVKDAHYMHPELPWPVENISAAVDIVDGRVNLKKATARVAGANIELTLESRADKPPVQTQGGDDPLKRLEDRLAKLELCINGLALDDVLFRNLPERAIRVREQFSPTGQVNLTYKFTRESAGWKRELELRPKQITMSYEKFKYPVTDVRGWVKRTVLPVGEPVTTIDLVGTAGGQMITIKGQITGDGQDPGINLRVTGANVPIDKALYTALPDKYKKMVERFHASGRGDFVAEFVQDQGVNRCDNEFRIDIRDARLCHEEFPYPLEKVKGRLYLRVSASDLARPTRPLASQSEREEMILDEVTAVHAGTTITLRGSKRSIPGSPDKKLVLNLAGGNCPIDDDLRATCKAFKIDPVWRTFNPSGRLSFTAVVELIERMPPPDQPDNEISINPATDLKLTLSFAGATVTPSFFRYELNDFSGWLEYKNNHVDLLHFAARHGESRVRLERGEALFYPDGVVFANLGPLEVKPFIADEALIKALPSQLASGVAELKLQGRSELLVKQLVVLTPPDSPANPGPSLPPGRIHRALYQPSALSNVPAAGESELPLARQKQPQGTFDPLVPRRQLPAPSLPAQPDPVVFWDMQLKLFGASFDTGVVWDQAFGAIGCMGRYEGTHVGQVRGAFWLDSTAIAGQPVSRIGGRFSAAEQLPEPARTGEYLPTELEFRDLTGDLFHGGLGGEAHVWLTSPVRFNLWLKVADVQLVDVAKHYKLGSDADLKGIAQAQLQLHNRLDPITGQLVVEGKGVIDVPTGRMYNLPILLDLVKLFKFETPNKTAFEEAHAIFSIQGDRVKVEQIDLIGRAVCLGGSGEFDISGNYVKFDFYTIISQVLARLINTPVGDLTAFLSKNLFVIKLTRENGELKYKPEPVPIVTEPARMVADRLRLRAAQLFGGR